MFGFLKKKEDVKPTVKREVNFVSQHSSVVEILNDYVQKMKEIGRVPLYTTRFEEEILQDGEMGKPFKANYYRDDKLIFTVNHYPNSNSHLGGIKVLHDWDKEDIKTISEYVKILGWEVNLKGDPQFKALFIQYAVQLSIDIFNPELKDKIEEVKDKYEEHLKQKRKSINQHLNIKN
jgi:hypothetical protein